MKSGDRNKELYRQLRALPWDRLWDDEVARFDQGAPGERSERVAVIRAVGVVFSESGPAAQKENVRLWLLRLLRDPSEQIRRYAMAALPKIGAGPGEEAELLSLLRTTPLEREKKFLGRTLEKIGGTATLTAIGDAEDGAHGFLRQTARKVKANIARREGPNAIRMDSLLSNFAGLRIHLRGRKGLEQMVRDEVEACTRTRGKFRIGGVGPGLVALTPVAPFALSDIYALRCFDTVGFVPGAIHPSNEAEPMEALAKVITSALARRVLETFTEGPIRYRLDFISKGHQRSAVRLLADRVHAHSPEMLNDARAAAWAIDIHPDGRGNSVEMRPKLTLDPRFYYRRQDVPAASHPPLAACMARLAGKVDREIVWDPFCGSGLELIERALLGGVLGLHGTDLSAQAIAAARANFAAAGVKAVPSKFTCCDFRAFASIEGLGPNTVTLIMTNPPMGQRVPIGNLRGLIEELFTVAAAVLLPGGRFVLANPLTITPPSSLKLQLSQPVDLGGFVCRLEKYLKISR